MIAPNSRELAARILQHREDGNQFTEDLLASELSSTTLSPEDRALVQELTYGTVRWQATLDWLIQRKTPIGRTQKPALQILLRLGLYQLFWLERIPDHAAVHETVALAKCLGFGHRAGFVNAILRGYLRERVQTEALLESLPASQPALAYSHPEWLFDRWEQHWGRTAAIRLMQLNNQPPKTYARLNALKTSAEALLQVWQKEGVVYEPLAFDWADRNQVFELKSHPPLRQLPSFQSGSFYIQDPSTILAIRELAPEPGETILDVCAAPGGKTTLIAQRMLNRGRIVAADFNAQRLQLLEENCVRLGVTCVDIAHTSGTGSAAAADQPFDRVLLDAPCSNTGVMRRRVDLRWRIRPEEIDRLRATQLSLLASAAKRVREGGTLIYSTCSLEPEENQQVIELFLRENVEFRLAGARELWPFQDSVDGAYVARLHRS